MGMLLHRHVGSGVKPAPDVATNPKKEPEKPVEKKPEQAKRTYSKR